MRDPYTVLGLAKGASEADIKKAFRRAAKIHHPDRNRDDPKAQDRFAELNSAYEILGDSAKRAQFDRGEIGADGKPAFRGFDGFGQGAGGFGGGGFGGGARPGGPNGGPSAAAEDIFRQFTAGMGAGMGGRRAPGGNAGGFDASDIFGRMFGDTSERARGATRKPPPPQKGAEAQATMTLTLEEIVEGAPKRVKMPTGRELEIAIPRNVSDGQTVRLRGQGYTSPTGGEPGDVMLTIRIAPHERFAVEGRDLRMRFPVPLADAVLGGPVFVATLSGGIEIMLPPMTSGGKTFRLRGKGLPHSGAPAAEAGDLYATVEIMLPDKPDPALAALMQTYRR
jgi:DnaJ-class molecular chaperone